MSLTRLPAIGLGLVLTTTLAIAAEGLKVGDPAPDFSLQGSDGKTYKLADFKGSRPVVIAWFPKAFTGGCTKQCRSYAQSGKLLKPLDVAYFTASVDEVQANTDFAKSLECDYPILSDPTKEVAKAYGVLSPRGVAQRWTFYIDRDGIVRAIDQQIDTENAAGDTVAKLKELGLVK